MNRILFLGLPLVSATIAAIAVYQKPTPALQARRWLVASMACGALSALLLMHYYHPTLRLSLTLDLLYDAVLLCLAPCFYLCLQSLTALDGLQKKDYLVFVPGALLMLIILLLNALMGPSEAHAALEEIVLRTQPATQGHTWAYRAYAFFGHTFYRSYVILSLMTVFYHGAIAIHGYKKHLEDYLADIPASLTWAMGLLYVSFVLFALVGMVFAACEYAQTLTRWIVPMLSVGIALSFAMMGYFASQVTLSAEMIRTMSQHHTEAHTPHEQDPFRERLAIIEQEQLYRDANLTIFTLSRKIGTNRTYLARAFRECYGETFSEHINRLRIEEAIRLMQEKRLSLTEIALLVGYNSTTSLYRNFVRIHHCSPTEYLSREH